MQKIKKFMLIQQKVKNRQKENQLLNIKILTLYDFEKDEPVVPITYEQKNN